MDFILKTLMSIGLIFVASHGYAQGNLTCKPYEVWEKTLAEDFEEQPVARALSLRDNILMMMEVWVSSDGETYSILMRTENGLACLVNDGVTFEFLDSPPEGEPA